MGQNSVRNSTSLKGILSGSFDPSVTAFEAPRGTLYYKKSAPVGLFQKTDDGLSTNWSSVSGGGGGGGVSGLEWPTDNIVVGDIGKMAMLSLTTGKAEVYAYQSKIGVSYVIDRPTAQPAPGDTFAFTVVPPFTFATLTAGVDFMIGATLNDTVTNIVSALNMHVTYSPIFVATKIGPYIRHDRNAFAQTFDTTFGLSFWGKTVGKSSLLDPTALTAPNSIPLGTILGVSGANAIIDAKGFVKCVAGEQILANTFVTPADGTGKMICGASAFFQQNSKSNLIAITPAAGDGNSFLAWNSYNAYEQTNIGELISIAGM